MLEKILNETQRKILDLLLRNGESTLSEMTEEIGLSKPSILRQVRGLGGMGLVSEKMERTGKGRQVKYSLRQFSLIYSVQPDRGSVVRIESKSRFDPSHLLLEQVSSEEFRDDLRVLVEAVGKLDDEDVPIAIILFGSVAEGNGTWKSDIDVAVIAPRWDAVSKGRIGKLVSDACLRTKHLIKPCFLTVQQFGKADSVLVREIRSSGMVVYCDQYESDVIWRGMMRYKSTTR